MSFIPFSDAVEAVVEMTLDSIPSVMTLGFVLLSGGGITVAEMASLGGALHDWLFTDFKPAVAASVDFLNIHITDLDSVSGPVVDTPLGFVGTGTGTAVPNNVALTVTFVTALRGRSYRGRNFVGGIPAANLLNQYQWDSAVLAGFNGIYGDMAGHVADVSWQHVVLSRYLDKAPRELGHTQPVLTYRANEPVHTQRRRLT